VVVAVKNMIDFRPITSNNYHEIVSIYEQGIATGIATFQLQATSWEEWDKSHCAHSRISLYQQDTMLGWAALTPVSNRCVYGGVAEVSVYIASNQTGKGYGKILLQKLIESSEENDIWTLQSSIFSENNPSIALHQTCGFRMVGYREKIGQLYGIWKDNVLLEKRSTKTGK
jgi:L-amino acid N-acyltransferase YncA